MQRFQAIFPQMVFLPGPSGRGFCLRFPIRQPWSQRCLAWVAAVRQAWRNIRCQPEMRPEVFFDGFLTAHGVIKVGGEGLHASSTPISTQRDGVGTLDESFVFDDGETSNGFGP